MRMRLIQKPGLSFTTIAVFPIRRPNATAVLVTAGAVRDDGITSSSGMRATGEKKCMPITRSGRFAASAILAIGMVEVLEANTAASRVAASTSFKTCRLTARSSNTASITSSAPPKPAYVSPPDRSATSRACSYLVIRRRVSRSSRISRAAASPFATRGRSASFIRTSTPACATAVPAMPDPEVLLERRGGEEDLHELARHVGDGKLAEQLRLALQSLLDPVLEPVLDRLEGGEGRRIVAAGLRQHLLTRRPEHEPAAQRVAVEQPGDERPPSPSPAPPLRSPAARHPARRGDGDVLEDGGVHELVHDPEPERLARSLDLPRKDDVERGARADESRQSLAATGAGEDAELHFGQAELGLGVIRSDAVVAGEGELESAPQAGPVNADGDRLGKARHALEQLLPRVRQALRLGGARDPHELLDIRARDEVVALAGEERGGLHRGVPLEHLERRQDLLLHRLRNLVDGLALQIEDDHRDAINEPPGERGAEGGRKGG